MLLKVSIFVVGVLEISPAGFSHSEKKVLLGTEMILLHALLPTLLVLCANKLAVMTKYRSCRGAAPMSKALFGRLYNGWMLRLT